MSCKGTQTGKLSRTNAVWSSLGDRILGDFYLYCVLCLYTSYNTHSIFSFSFFCKTPYHVVWKPSIQILCEWGPVISNNLSYWQYFDSCRLGNFSSHGSTHISRILPFQMSVQRRLCYVSFGLTCQVWKEVCSLWQLYIKKKKKNSKCEKINKLLFISRFFNPLSWLPGRTTTAVGCP